MTHWTTSSIPPQVGRTIVVTGTGGLGFEDALALARAGAHVILAGRNPKKGAEAVAPRHRLTDGWRQCGVDLATDDDHGGIHHRREQAWQDAGEQQLTDGLAREHAVQHEKDAGRNE